MDSHNLLTSLRRAAVTQQNIADKYEDCSFAGESPGDSYRELSSILMQAALRIEQLEAELTRLRKKQTSKVAM